MTAHYKFLHEHKPRSIPQPPSVFRVEGENVTYEEIAQRIGVALNVAQSRMYKLREASGPITWARLKAFGRRRGGKQKAA